MAVGISGVDGVGVALTIMVEVGDVVGIGGVVEVVVVVGGVVEVVVGVGIMWME